MQAIEKCSYSCGGPWAVGGDFDIILSPDEKKGGLLHTLSESLDFINY